MDALILAGGFVTRLAETLPGVPKILAPIQGVPFIEILLRWLEGSGRISRVIFALGHLSEQIEDYLRTRLSAIAIDVSIETFPLGTGGALLQAMERTTSDQILAMNGDCFFDMPLPAFFQFHQSHGAPATIACRSMEDVSRYGSLQFDAESGRVFAMQEKSSTPHNGWINCGIYLFDRRLVEGIPVKQCSLEKELMPVWIQRGLFAYRWDGTFIDIGTARSYQEAQKVLETWV